MITLTQGLKEVAGSASVVDWKQAALWRLSGNHAAIAPGPNTLAAEAGLGLGGSQAYWFINHVDDIYGRILMVWVPKVPNVSGQVSLFDTGGLWGDYMKFSSGLVKSVTDKVAYLKAYTLSLGEAQELFLPWCLTAFANVAEYAAGHSKPDYVLHQGIDIGLCDAPSWSWEFRRPLSQPPDLDLRLIAVFWPALDLRKVRAYIRKTIVDDQVYNLLMTHISSTARIDSSLRLSTQFARQFVAIEAMQP